MDNAGYSGTPLAKKLGIKEGFLIQIVNAPVHYPDLFSDFPSEVQEDPEPAIRKDFIHIFSKSREELGNLLPSLKNSIKQNGMIWISWPKKTSRIKTDLNGNVIREIGLKNGLVDIKVCAVDETWSGLKFVIPVKDRGK